MVAIQKALVPGLYLASNYRDVATPELAARDQYNIVKYLGGAGPYIQFEGFGIDTNVPEQCTVELVQLYMRHGERFPGLSAGQQQHALVKKLQNYNKTITGPLSFLNDYTYYVQNEENYELETTPWNTNSPYTGYDTAVKAGSAFRAKYNHLYNENKTLPVFAAASKRVYDTGNFFVQGFLGPDYLDESVDHVVLSEKDFLGINTLVPRWGCKAFNSSSNDELIAQFPSNYTQDIVKRLTDGNDGLNLTTKNVSNLFQLCAYELSATGYSPFCDIFTQDELVLHSYASDLQYYYTSGPGGNLTRTVGAIQLNASLALLKQTESDNKIWLSFTHDTDIEIFHAALGLFDPLEPLPVNETRFRDMYHHVNVVPMGSRTITEKLKCGDETYVRFIINDAVVPVPKCQDGPGFSCKLSDFENYVAERLSGIDIVKDCKVPDDVPQELTFYWDYQSGQYNATAERIVR